MNATTDRMENPESRIQKAEKLVVRIGEFAVLFYTKPADDVGRPYDRQVYEIVPDAEATTFDSIEVAMKWALSHGVSKFTICPLENKTEPL